MVERCEAGLQVGECTGEMKSVAQKERRAQKARERRDNLVSLRQYGKGIEQERALELAARFKPPNGPR